MKRLYLGILAGLFFLTGCSYTGYLQKGFHETSKPIANRIDLHAALVNTQELQDLRFQEYTGGRTFTFYVNPAFNEELAKELSGVFSECQILSTPRELDKFNIQVIPTLNLEYIDGSAWNGQYRYKITTIMTIKDPKANNTIDSFKNTQDIIFSPTAGMIFLDILTGLSLFILSPITIPIETQMAGDKAISLIAASISRSIKIVSYEIANSPKIYNYGVK